MPSRSLREIRLTDLHPTIGASALHLRTASVLTCQPSKSATVPRSPGQSSLSPRRRVPEVIAARLHQSLSPRQHEASSSVILKAPLVGKLSRVGTLDGGSLATATTQGSISGGELVLPSVVYSRRLIGLQNYGNTCFCNVILQGLLSCEDFCRHWLRRATRMFVNTESEYKGSLLRAWTAFLQDVYSLEEHDSLEAYSRAQTVYRPASTVQLRGVEEFETCDWAPRSHREVVGSHRRLLELIRLHNPQFAVNTQGDAHEFLQVLLKGLSTETHRPPLTAPPSKSFDARRRLELNSETEDMFRFHFVSHIQCLCCGRARRRYEAEYEWDLDLPLPELATVSLETLLVASATQQQIVTLHCSRCKTVQPSRLTRRPHKLPDRFVCVQIKRFAYNRDTQQTYRLGTNIELPSSRAVDFGQYCSGSNKGHDDFELFGLTLQRGSLETGHYSGMYLVDHRVALDGEHGPTWFYFSDERVHRLTESAIDKDGDGIYLLWFRRSTGWRAIRRT